MSILARARPEIGLEPLVTRANLDSSPAQNCYFAHPVSFFFFIFNDKKWKIRKRRRFLTICFKKVFERYVRERADLESREKSEALKKKKDDFRKFLKEVISNPKNAPPFADFQTKYVRDERFKAIEKIKDRESLFNDYLVELRKHGSGGSSDRKLNFNLMLQEFKHLHRHSSWTETRKQFENDARYKAIESSSKREEYFREYCKELPSKKVTTDNNASKNDDKYIEMEEGERME